LNRWPR